MEEVMKPFKLSLYTLCISALLVPQATQPMGTFAKKISTKIVAGIAAGTFASTALALSQQAKSGITESISGRDSAFIFSHGLGGNKNNATFYKEGGILWPKPIHSFNYPDVTQDDGFNAAESSLGQAPDIAALKNAYEQAKSTHKDLVFFGVSRGAATIINFLGTNACPEAKAAILESPFDCVESIARNKAWILGSISHSVVPSFYKKYDINGPQPIQNVHKIPKELPILFVCSKKDALIPARSTQALYKELKKNGHEHAYILTVNTGAHANILSGDEGIAYRNVVHAFYQKYNMPHHPKCAEQGRELLQKCQPSIEELTPPTVSWWQWLSSSSSSKK